MRFRLVVLAILLNTPSAFAQIYVTCEIGGDDYQISSSAGAEYRGSGFKIDPYVFLSMSNAISGPKSAQVGKSGYGRITSIASVDNYSFRFDRLPGGCYRGQADATATSDNGNDLGSQGAGSPQKCVAGDPPLADRDPINGPGICNDPSCMGSWEPLVLDLNGDGVNTTGAEEMVWFDLDGDGVNDHITWTNGGTIEGFLWVNLSGKNRVDNGSELFGIGTVMPDGTKAKDGFEALAIYDQPAQGGNADGMIDSHDGVWNKLRVWVDENHNGVCEPGEVSPLHKYGVEAISLAATRTNIVDSQGNGHYLTSRYRRSVGGGMVVLHIDGVTFRGEPR